MSSDALLSLRSLVDPCACPCGKESEWLNALPPGTLLPAGSLARFRWPVDPFDNRYWLFVSCSTSVDVEGYLRWLLALPDEGVLVDPSDQRLRCLLQSIARPQAPCAGG